MTMNLPSLESTSGCDETPSVTKGRRKDATAANRGGIKSKTGAEGVGYNTGIEGSCGVFEVSVENVGSISSASMCFSKLELTREDHTSKSNLLSE